YAAAEASGTLTFLAGDRVDQRLRVGARLRRGGRTLAASGGEGRFGPGGSSELALRVRRCAPPSGAAAMSLGSVAGATHVLAADLDGDGRDEVIAETPTGLVVLGGAALTEEPVALLAVGDVDG